MELDATGRMIRPEADPAPAPALALAPIPERKAIDFDNRAKELNFVLEGPDRFEQAIKNPLDGIKVRSLGLDARNQTKEEFKNQKNQGDNSPDAFRHALWSVKLTRELGTEKAKQFTDSYERNRPKQSKGSLLMDVENNRIGRELVLDPNHKFFGNTKDRLEALALVDANGGIHDSIRNIVLSAIEGEDLEMRLTNPVAPSP